MKNTLKAMVLAGTIALAGCGVRHPEYNFTGEIDGEKISYTEKGTSMTLHRELEVTKTNGVKMVYISDPLVGWGIDKVRIDKNGETIFYQDDVIGSDALKVAQKQFDGYRQKILEVKREKAMQDIKN